MYKIVIALIGSGFWSDWWSLEKVRDMELDEDDVNALERNFDANDEPKKPDDDEVEKHDEKAEKVDDVVLDYDEMEAWVKNRLKDKKMVQEPVWRKPTQPWNLPEQPQHRKFAMFVSLKSGRAPC